jgi:hypothetical protein
MRPSASPHSRASDVSVPAIRIEYSPVTASCAAQDAEAGGCCTQLETFRVNIEVRATDRYRIEVANTVPRSNFRSLA